MGNGSGIETGLTSEPTLYNGEDLDVPTFLRRSVSLKR